MNSETTTKRKDSESLGASDNMAGAFYLGPLVISYQSRRPDERGFLDRLMTDQVMGNQQAIGPEGDFLLRLFCPNGYDAAAALLIFLKRSVRRLVPIAELQRDRVGGSIGA